MDARAIDLTQSTSNSEDEKPTPKRKRHLRAQEDDDVQLVEEAPKQAPRSADAGVIADEDDLMITGASGAVSPSRSTAPELLLELSPRTPSLACLVACPGIN